MRSFDDHLFDPTTGELWYQGESIPLQAQPARLLELLTARPGRMVSREAIRQQLWEETTHVDFDRCLNFYVRQLRIALGDSARSPRFIETLPRRGYRFLAAVEDDTISPVEPRKRSRRSLLAVATLSLLFGVVSGHAVAGSANDAALAEKLHQSLGIEEQDCLFHRFLHGSR